MKRLFIICMAWATTVVVMAQKEIVILHTNDTHSCVSPLNPNLADTMLANRGGFIRRAEMIRQQREMNPKLLLLDSGDFSQGSPYYNIYKGEVEIGLMNLMGYDAATIGNHEFDFGLENMARLYRMAKFPIVCANYDFTDTPVEGLVKPYVIIRRNGIKIGIFGLAPKMEGLVFAANCKGVKYNDPIKTGNETARILKRDKGCDVVICLSHLGWDIKGTDDTEMMSGTRDIDLILGGHSHTYFDTLRYKNNLDGVPVPNDQNGKHGVFVGKLKLDFKKKGK